MKFLTRIVTLASAIAVCMPAVSVAQEEAIEEIVTTGTRGAARSATDSPVAIDAFNEFQLDQQPSGDMTETLRHLVPSFHATALTGDGSSFIRSTSLRGLPPDEVLLLVNGKRRHRSALIQALRRGHECRCPRGRYGTDPEHRIEACRSSARRCIVAVRLRRDRGCHQLHPAR